MYMHGYTEHTHMDNTQLNSLPNAIDITGKAELSISNIIQLLMIYTVKNIKHFTVSIQHLHHTFIIDVLCNSG